MNAIPSPGIDIGIITYCLCKAVKDIKEREERQWKLKKMMD